MCDMRKCECATRTAYEGDTQLMWVLRWTQFRSCVQYSWEQKEESLLFLDCQLTPIPFDYQPHSSSHHFPPLMFWPHQYHLLLFQTSHKTSPHPLPCPELFRSSRLRGQYGSGARDSLIHGLSSLSWPQCCSITALFPFSVLHTNTHPLHSLSDLLFSLSSLSPAFCAPSLAQAVLGCHIDWGFYSPSLTSSSLPLSIPFVPQCTVMLKPLWSACLCLCTAFLNVSIYCKLYYHAMHNFSLSSKRTHTHKHTYYRYILTLLWFLSNLNDSRYLVNPHLKLTLC